MFDRAPEQGLFDVLVHEGIGGIVFSPLAKGMLTNRYFAGIPADARASRDPRFLRPEHITDAVLAQTRAARCPRAGARPVPGADGPRLGAPAAGRTSALIGASKVGQIEDNLGAIKNLDFTRRAGGDRPDPCRTVIGFPRPLITCENATMASVPEHRAWSGGAPPPGWRSIF